jgi:hypothetical protein
MNRLRVHAGAGASLDSSLIGFSLVVVASSGYRIAAERDTVTIPRAVRQSGAVARCPGGPDDLLQIGA